jgi:hypothetical protein
MPLVVTLVEGESALVPQPRRQRANVVVVDEANDVEGLFVDGIEAVVVEEVVVVVQRPWGQLFMQEMHGRTIPLRALPGHRVVLGQILAMLVEPIFLFEYACSTILLVPPLPKFSQRYYGSSRI